MSIYDKINISKPRKLFAVLIDPDKYDRHGLQAVISTAVENQVDYFLVGGSLLTEDRLDETLQIIKDQADIPVILFPGSILQINEKADALLLLSLISGRNADLLIGKHVIAAPYLKNSKLEILPTGYMLIESGAMTTALYVSNTTPIPRSKDDIAVCTAMAGEMLGLRMIYMDAGSGAEMPISTSMIRKVKENISIPLIVGGGIRNPEQALASCKAGADMIVVGNAIENDQSRIKEIAHAVHSL
ncbi:MAG: geranylgeranylglyceryl/heptaprenylglyceryl phosphate synthase [Bacteroidales bacterium]|nr:geranylgeranylglyceryl/heptaprenylglyceryl phosphate synthase [Bacteroidales bacterium]